MSIHLYLIEIVPSFYIMQGRGNALWWNTQSSALQNIYMAKTLSVKAFSNIKMSVSFKKTYNKYAKLPTYIYFYNCISFVHPLKRKIIVAWYTRCKSLKSRCSIKFLQESLQLKFGNINWQSAVNFGLAIKGFPDVSTSSALHFVQI